MIRRRDTNAAIGFAGNHTEKHVMQLTAERDRAVRQLAHESGQVEHTMEKSSDMGGRILPTEMRTSHGEWRFLRLE